MIIIMLSLSNCFGKFWVLWNFENSGLGCDQGNFRGTYLFSPQSVFSVNM